MCTTSGTGTFTCPGTEYCGNPAQFGLSKDQDVIILKRYLYFGIRNFDDIFNSFLVVFQIITGEAWSTYMYNLMDADSPYFAAFYTITIVLFGNYFMMNLVLAVIIHAFITITRRELLDQSRRLSAEAQHKAKVKHIS